MKDNEYAKKDNEDVKKDNEIFNTFLKLYTNGIIRISFSRSGFGYFYGNPNKEKLDEIELYNEDLQIIKDPKSKEFIRTFIRELRKEILFESASTDYKDYIDKFLEENPEIKEAIKIKCNSSLDLLETVTYSILPNMNKDLKIDAYSVLLELNLRDKNNSSSPRNIQLTIDDLQYIRNTLDDAIDDIEKLKTELQDNEVRS